MENYSKGSNIEEPLERSMLPIPNLPQDIVWIQVKGGSKMSALLQVAVDAMKSDKDVLWSGSGPAITKVISCSEIIKRNFKQIHQFNKVAYTKCMEEWEPKLEGLDKLVVRRDVPSMFILLSKLPINNDLPGYQSPETEERQSGRTQRPQGTPRQRHIDAEQFGSVGLRSANYKERRQYRNES